MLEWKCLTVDIIGFIGEAIDPTWPFWGAKGVTLLVVENDIAFTRPWVGLAGRMRPNAFTCN